MEVLERISLFAGLKPEQCKHIELLAITRHYRRGENVFNQGDRWPYLIWVVNGQLTAAKVSLEGRSLVMGKLVQGDVFWGMSFFIPESYSPVSLSAAEDSQLMLWTQASMLPFLLDNGEFAWDLCKRLADRMHRASMMVEELAFQPVASRLARLLLDHFSDKPDGCLARDLTLDEMAAQIGTTREMVCRILYKLADEKLIQVTRTEFYLCDHAGLAKFAGR